MSRLGDLLMLERTRRGMTHKQVAKLCGVTEKYLADVEAGTRIIADDQARRILKRIGLEHQTEADFSLDDIAATVDLVAAKSGPAPARAPEAAQAAPAPKPVLSLPAEDTPSGSIWLDALAGVLRQVPVYNAAWQITDHRTMPVLGGRIEGAAPDKALYFAMPDDSMRGFRIHAGDLLFVVPAQSPIDGAVMLVQYGGHRTARKIQLEGARVTLQSFDRAYEAVALDASALTCIGRCTRLEAAL